MKKTYLLMFCFGLVLLCGTLFVLSENAEGAIDFALSGAGMTCSVKTNYSGTLELFYQQDLRTPTALDTTTKVAARTSANLFTYALRPCDNRSFTENQFYVRIYNFKNMGSANIQFNVTDQDGTMYTIDIVVVANGTYTIPSTDEWISNCTNSSITTFIVAPGGSTHEFNYMVNQSRFGMIWRINPRTFIIKNGCFAFGNTTGNNNRVIIRDCTVTSCRDWMFPSYAKTLFTDNRYSRVSYKNLTVYQLAAKGIVSHNTNNPFLTMDNCFFMSNKTVAAITWLGNMYIGNINNSVFHTCYITGMRFELRHFVISNVTGGRGAYTSVVASATDFKIKDSTIGVFYGTLDNFDVQQTTFQNVQYVAKFTSYFSGTVTNYFIDCTSDTGVVVDPGSTMTGIQFFWCFSVDTRCIDNASANLSGVTLSVYNRTNVSQIIATSNAFGLLGGGQIVIHTLFDESLIGEAGNPFRFVYEKPGYQTVNFTRVVNESLNLTVMMKPNVTITLHEDLTNVSATHESQWNGSGYNVWVNGSSPLNFLYNLLNCYGKGEPNWDGGQQNIYVNYTGTGGGGTSFLVKNNLPMGIIIGCFGGMLSFIILGTNKIKSKKKKT